MSEALSAEQVAHVAKLARLELTPAEAESYGRELSDILAYMERLGQVDTQGVEATLGGQPPSGGLRADVSRASLPNEAALSNAPRPEGGAFRIPRILEEA